MKNRKLLTLALAGAMTLSLAAPALAAGIPEGWTPADGARTAAGPWYAEAVDYVQDKGLMTGTDKGFEPETVLTAASILQTLYNKEGRPDAAQETNPWYADAAVWARNNGIADLTEDADATRGDVKTMLDAYCAMKYMDGAELMQGNENGDMMLDKTLTRAEFATILMRLDALEPYAIAATVFIDVDEQDKIPAHTIPAIVTLPTAEGTFPAVVMLHGTGSNKHEAGGGYDMAAPAMAKAGIATVRFDFMGIDESEASYTDYCFTSANIDAKAAADYIGALKKVDGEKLAVMGWSQGGTNALLAAAAYPETFKAVITWAGSVTSKTDSEEFKAQHAAAKKDGYYVQEFDWREPLHVGLRWYEENLKFDKLAETAKIEAPILAIQGLKDTTVLPENAEKIVEAAKNEATRAYYIEDCDHTFNVFSGDYTAINEAIAAGIGFLQSTLNGKVGPATAHTIGRYGGAVTDMSVVVMKGAGFEIGDILKLTVEGKELEAMLPYCTSYSNVDGGSPLLISTDGKNLNLACNNGSFVKIHPVEAGDRFYLEMGEKAGYLEEYIFRNINSLRTNDREDYDSDEAFANFRPIVMGDIAEGKLYRASSPVNPQLGRNTYVDTFAKEAGIKTILNMADTEEERTGYDGYQESYASTVNTIALSMTVDVHNEEFASKFQQGLKFLLENEGPYLIHCTEGKDRTGFVAAVLEALMGADVEEIVNDYMLTYENFYHMENPSARWTRFAESNILADLMKLAGVETREELAQADLVKVAETYLEETVGLTVEEVTALKDALKG